MEAIKDLTLRPTFAQIDLGKLKQNFNAIQNKAKKSIVMPILKANAYGHGMVTIAKYLEKNNAKIFGVAFLEEGILLRKEGIKADILVLGGLSGYQVEFFIKYNLIITASSIDKLKLIDWIAHKMNKKARVHLKIDTGMERIGVHYYNSKKFFEVSISLKNIVVEGVYSHFANSDADDLYSTYLQFDRFMEAVSYFEKRDYYLLRHIANSGAIIRFEESQLDMVRTGIALYGYMPDYNLENTLKLSPILSLYSKVVYFKVAEKGAKVSYGSTWEAEEQTRLITIPIGYGDGYPRALSNKGFVLIKGKKYPIVGRVCMDQVVVDIGKDEVFNQDEVVIIGKSKNRVITADDIAKKVDSISYEILTQINTRVPRIYINEDK
jgi:alanine racemase